MSTVVGVHPANVVRAIIVIRHNNGPDTDRGSQRSNAAHADHATAPNCFQGQRNRGVVDIRGLSVLSGRCSFMALHEDERTSTLQLAVANQDCALRGGDFVKSELLEEL